MITLNENGTVTLSESRQAACIDAVLELESLCAVLPKLAPETGYAIGLHHAVRAIAKRMEQLTGALVVGLVDPSFDTALLDEIIKKAD